jgi:hypothetical protein
MSHESGGVRLPETLSSASRRKDRKYSSWEMPLIGA